MKVFKEIPARGPGTKFATESVFIVYEADSHLSAHQVTTVTDAGGFSQIRPAEEKQNYSRHSRIKKWKCYEGFR